MMVDNIDSKLKREITDALDVKGIRKVYLSGFMTGDDELNISCMCGRPGKLDRYVDNVLKDTGIKYRIFGSSSDENNSSNIVWIDKPWNSGKDIEEPVEFWSNDLIKKLNAEYPDHIIVNCPIDLRQFRVEHTDNCWEDGVAVYKMFSRNEPIQCDIRKGDKVYIGLQRYNGYNNLYFSNRQFNWYHCNQLFNDGIYNGLLEIPEVKHLVHPNL